jgi:hypothetical protein
VIRWKSEEPGAKNQEAGKVEWWKRRRMKNEK